jgi:light-regulated signal transduction histidine kinase (bacteriophytochrome)
VPSEARLAEEDLELDTTVGEELQEFSYIVSHDLAASFRHLAGFSRLLLGELGDNLTKRQREHAEQIRTASDKCLLMMEQLLVFSRVQQKPLEPVSKDAAATLQLAMLQLATEVRDAEAEIEVEPLGEVYADPALLAIVFHHALDNAIKFRRPGVRPRIAVRAAHDEACWRLRISDNGLGVAPARRDQVFGMFQRLNGEDAYPGVGAGLAICRRIARRHGGEARFIDCAEGACFELALPRARPAQSGAPTQMARLG